MPNKLNNSNTGTFIKVKRCNLLGKLHLTRTGIDLDLPVLEDPINHNQIIISFLVIATIEVNTKTGKQRHWHKYQWSNNYKYKNKIYVNTTITIIIIKIIINPSEI